MSVRGWLGLYAFLLLLPLPFQKFTLYTWHPLLMLLYLVISTDSTFLVQLQAHTHHKTQHRIRHLASIPLLLLGTLAIYVSRELRHKPHFATSHSKLALVAMALIGFQVVAGLYFVFARPKRRRIYIWLHRICGYSVLFLMWWSAALASIKEGVWPAWMWWASVGAVGYQLSANVNVKRLLL